jgi:hypothetical protein
MPLPSLFSFSLFLFIISFFLSSSGPLCVGEVPTSSLLTQFLPLVKQLLGKHKKGVEQSPAFVYSRCDVVARVLTAPGVNAETVLDELLSRAESLKPRGGFTDMGQHTESTRNTGQVGARLTAHSVSMLP